MSRFRPDGGWLQDASIPLQISPLGAATVKIANGPLVFTGCTLVNTGAAQATVTFTDGSNETVLVVVLAAGADRTTVMPDDGVLVTTELDITSSAAGPVSGAAYIRHPEDYVREHEEWLPRSEAMTSPSPQGPRQMPPSP